MTASTLTWTTLTGWQQLPVSADIAFSSLKKAQIGPGGSCSDQLKTILMGGFQHGLEKGIELQDRNGIPS